MPANLMWQLVRVPWNGIYTVLAPPMTGFPGDRKTSGGQHGHVLLQGIQRLERNLSVSER